MSAEWGITSALVFGLLGSFSHCAAMCGALAAAVGGKPARALAYHAGRLTTYALIGAAVGASGSLVNFAGSYSPWMRHAAAVAGGVLLVISGLALLANRPFFERWISSRWLHGRARKWVRGQSIASGLGAGLILGFLPCGLVYSAASFALASANPLHGATYMLAFGLGTIPALALAAWLWRRVQQFHRLFRYAAGALLVSSGAYYLVSGFPG